MNNDELTVEAGYDTCKWKRNKLRVDRPTYYTGCGCRTHDLPETDCPFCRRKIEVVQEEQA